MFEAHVLHLLRKYLGEYVHGLSSEALRISVWKGDVVLRDLKLKSEALNALKLPVTVKAGFLGTITLKVPWKSLGKEPVIVLIDQVFILANPASDGTFLKEEDRERLFEAKLQQIDEAESATLEALSRSKPGNSPAANSWLGSLISTIIGNLKISISNVHIRYEDSVSNPGHPFSCGITLAKLAAFTMDEHGNETFDTSGALDKLRKSLQLERLAVYHDTNRDPWKLDKRWEDLSPKEWVEIFQDGINESSKSGSVSPWAKERTYLVSPINGVLKYHRLGNKEREDSNVPYEKASFVIADVSLTITEAQYHDWIKLMEAITAYRARVEISHLRPMVPVREGAALWWHYAAQAGLQQKKMCYRFSWEQIQHLCHLRRRYVQLYADSLQGSDIDYSELKEIEKDLDAKIILLWRFLAHAKVESVKSKEAAEQRMLKKRSWFPVRWRSTSVDDPAIEDSSASGSVEERLTKEEWEAVNKLLSLQPDEDLAQTGKDVQSMTHYMIIVSISKAAARIVNIDNTEIVCGRFENLNVATKLKQKSTHCDVTLQYYGFSSPEGSLAQSVSSEQKVNALQATFVHTPAGESVDWRLSATISPCHVTVLMESYERFLHFVKRSNAVSPALAMETATALQQKIEEVTRKAQEQFQMVLEEQSRFALDIDLDAPKVSVPIKSCSSNAIDSHLLIDLGHFTLQTKEDGQLHDHRDNLFSRFYISGRDIAAFFADCGSMTQAFNWGSRPPFSSASEDADKFYSLIDRCGIAVIVEQIKVPRPNLPSTRISVQIPSLGIHFSPNRYFRLNELLNLLNGAMRSDEQHTVEHLQNGLVPWNPPDLATEARILVWRGIGYSVAAWQPCYLVLSGLHLYVLESETSLSYQRCTSMAGKQICDVPPTNVGGSPFCVAVSTRGMDIQKALESFSALIVEFPNEEEKSTWLRELVQSTYRASAPPSVDILDGLRDGLVDFGESRASNAKAADLVVNGTVVETKVSVYGKLGDEEHEREQEKLILELLAGGGKMHLSSFASDLTMKVKLNSLKIMDELQDSPYTHSQYLACSVTMNQPPSSNPNLELQGKDILAATGEEDDVFNDALSDFTSLHDNVETVTHEMDPSNVNIVPSDVFYEAMGSDDSDFVSVTFLRRSSGSPDYDGVDTQMSVEMAKLEFYCNRPTLVALMNFGVDMSSVNSGPSGTNIENPADGPLGDKDRGEEHELAPSIKGLLGYGKGRVVFHLNMNVDSVTMFLNKEDGSQLAMFVQENFLLDFKVHPSSLSIDGTLGNLRVCDLSLGSDHLWGWLCDLRSQEAESLIQFTFNSYSVGDDDYEGYDFSLSGRLSAVRIIFLYRFVQEITAYFMELAPPRPEEAIQLVDKVAGIEWLIQKYEVDGASAIKLDLSLDNPIIVVPRNSVSKDFMQLDLGLLRIKNKAIWHGCPEKDPSAVRLDVLDIEVLGINMAVGIDGSIGKPMIREGREVCLSVRRSLRDVFRKVPTFALEVKVGSLHAVMSDKEYNVILNCALMNLSEQPNLPPSFRNSNSSAKDTIKLLADKVNMNSQVLLSRTVTIMDVELDYALLELCYGADKESPLAHVILEGLWVSYRMTSLSEADLYVTLPRFSILDNRPNTKAEMRLMLGSCTEVPKQMSPEHNDDLPNSTMFLMDGRWRLSSQSFVVRVQQPRVLVVPDFLLAVCEFFVPALGTITGREEMMDRKNDPISKKNIILSAPLYKQTEDVVQLSPGRQLVADAVGIDEYIYDGCGKTIRLAGGKEEKESNVFLLRPIIIIGRGKHLRFMNVKVENGLLLGKYTYLSNDSSYSVSPEDEVEISYVDDNTLDRSHRDSYNLEELSHSSNTSGTVQCELIAAPSLSFEAQVVSPEFTFYDSSKSFLDDTSHGEKLLRAKADFSFMFASKEDDTWIRGLVKDLTVEAGSGLVVLDPVDVSGGYTSVKDKMNISVVSTDIYVHLSLGVISLLFNLQSQASAALQFGNTDPLAPCTNFDRIWVSPKENGRLSNLTFWRPRAPSNYVVLGDCVTSRPSPPSQSVLAVSNAYDRVRKPLGFKLIGSFSSIQGQQSGEVPSNIDNDCSLWLPISPPGYLALGCVVHVGSQPPPNHIVHCVRYDLVTSTTVLECLLNSSANPLFESGFSIWRLDNCLGSFYAHASSNCPSMDYCFDLNHLLLWNSSQRQSSSIESLLDFNNQQETTLQASNQGATSSGWDVLRSMSKPSTYYMSTPNFERIWWDRGGELRRPFSIWRPIARLGYAILGDCITEGLEPPPLGIIFKADDPEISAKPVQFTKVAHIGKKGPEEVFFWYPIAPPGYAAVGCLVTLNDEAPSLESISCPRMGLVSQASIAEVPISRSSSSKGSNVWSIWKVENQACTFLARSDLKKPSTRLGFTIGDSVKPKTRDNVTAEMKIRCFSLTILDSFCGMMTPLFDATVTNIKLLSHGRLDTMNAMLVSSFAASTFNIHLEAWEPLVEPFDGIFKLETYEANLSIAKRIKVEATTILNVNLSAANFDTLAQATASWRMHRELEEKAMRLYEEAAGPDESVKKSAQLALDEDDFQTVIVENKLGCNIYLKKLEENSDMINLLPDNDLATLWIPPPRYSDRLNVSDESREPRCYVGIQIVEAKGLPLLDDGNSHRYFCALRLLVENQEANPQKVFPQSARTKCVKPVKPVTTKVNAFNEGTAKWNELFIFEFPKKGKAKLEVEVTNLAAKAGKGEVVGACSIPVGHGVGMLKKVASVKMLHQTHPDIQSVASYPLRKKGQNIGEIHPGSCLLVSTSFIEKSMVTDFDNKQGDENDLDGDMGFWVALGPEGPWDGFRSSLPLSVITRKLKDDFVALEVSMKNGKKHAVIRGLAMVTNDSDITLNISTCHVSVIYGHDSSKPSRSNVVVEEIFENQLHHPVSGWGNDGNNGPRRWSTRDFSFSSKEFFEPPLPPGWKWASTWTVDKSQFVDTDGWAYGPDYQSLKWPPGSPKSGTKSSRDAVRRRRWTRTRQEVDERAIKSQNFLDIPICPGDSAVLPWRSMAKDSNQCLQIRPSGDHCQISYAWGRPVSVEKDSSSGDQASLSRQSTLKHVNKTQISPLRLDHLEKKDLLWCCPGSNGGLFWLSIGTDASVLQSDLNAPVYDWKVSASAPLRLENRLPCSAEFRIWERLRDGKNVERQHGSVSSRGIVQIYTADIRNPIYMILFLQCGWVMEKDPVPILDMACGNHVSSFWMLHQQRKRRLRVSIERDLGGSTAAPKTIRFFVPYWINNDSSLPLAYRVVETESLESADMDSLLASKSLKSIRSSSKYSSTSGVGGQVNMKRNIQVLEAIEDTSPIPSMLSPQDYIGRGGVMLFSSRNDMYLSPRVGIAVALRNSENFSLGVSLLELEKKQRVDAMALSSDGTYYKLSAVLHMTSDRTKVVHFQPHTMFMNRVGCSVCLQQCDTESLEWLHPTEPPRHFGWQSGVPELIKLRMDGYQWSAPFTIGSEGLMSVCLRSEHGSEPRNLSIEVRGGAKTSRYEVILRPSSFSSPYRIENHSFFLPIQFRQVNGSNDSWRSLLPNAATSFSWEDLGRERYLELLIDGDDPLTSQKYDIDEIKDHQPIQVTGGPRRSLRVTIIREEKINVVKISDWMPLNEVPALMNRSASFVQQVSESKHQLQLQQSTLVSDSEFHFILEVKELGLSIVDHTPEEILYLSLKKFMLSYSAGLGSGISRLKMRMGGIQIDNQLPLTPMPVLFRLQRIGDDSDYILKLSVTQQSSGSLDLCIYPYIGFQGPENTAFLVNIHEPIIWRLHGLVRQANISRIFDSETSSVSVDPIIQIGSLNISEVRFKVTMAMSPTQRPAGVLGFWASLMTALGNTENMPVRVNQRYQENVSMRHSVLVSNAISNIKKDVLSQPLQLLSGVDILGNASSALGHMSKGVAALSMDKKFIQSRQRQDNKGVEDIGDVIREGGGALAKGIFRGVTGILTKPLEGAKASGVEGFVQGVGKGLIGAAAQPVSGVLDLLSKTTEGANAMRMKIAAAIASEDQLLRRRLPRAIGGDNLLRPYDEYKAKGQVILQLAESGSFLVDMFKVRGKFALTDAYEDHFTLPKGRIVMVTHRRVILLQQPSNLIAQKKFNPARDPCSVSWDVVWDDLVTMELTHGKKDHPIAPPSRVILYLHSKSADSRDQHRIIKCGRDSNQAFEVYSAIELARSTYSTDTMAPTKRKVTRPYAPMIDSVIPKGGYILSPQQMPSSIPGYSTLGAVNND